MAERDGGPAFPGEFADIEIYRELRPEVGPVAALTQARVNAPGMSLRDWFAGQALCGLTGAFGTTARQPGETQAQADARWAFERADAMLALRRRTAEPTTPPPHTKPK